MGEYETAIDLYEKALNIIEKEYGPDHPYFKITRNNLIGLYGENGEKLAELSFKLVGKYVEKMLGRLNLQLS